MLLQEEIIRNLKILNVRRPKVNSRNPFHLINIRKAKMSVIKINAITVPKDLGDEVARRFAERIKAVDGREGFQGFELMRPPDELETWLVVTRGDSEDVFIAWVQSPDFAEGHRSAMEAANEHPEPLPLTAELWSYTVELQADGSND